MILGTHYKLNRTSRTVLYQGLQYIRVKKDVVILSTNNEFYTLFIKGKAFITLMHGIFKHDPIPLESPDYYIYYNDHDKFEIYMTGDYYSNSIVSLNYDNNLDSEILSYSIRTLISTDTIKEELERVDGKYFNIGRCLYLEDLYVGYLEYMPQPEDYMFHFVQYIMQN